MTIDLIELIDANIKKNGVQSGSWGGFKKSFLSNPDHCGDEYISVIKSEW